MSEASAHGMDPRHWRAARWSRQGYDRLYVHSPSGLSIGWYDLGTGDLHAVEPWMLEPLTQLVLAWIDSPEARSIGRALPHPHAPAPHITVRPRMAATGRLRRRSQG